jgi:hypothetical protein
MHQASGSIVVATERLMGALVASWALAPTCHHSYSSGSTNQWLVVATDLLLLVVFVVVVAATLSGSSHVWLDVLSYPWGG